jgi:hypothetical protein
MNELKLLEDMCAEVPAPGEDRLAALRARVLGETEQTARPGHAARPQRRARVLTWPRLAWAAATAVALVIALTLAGVIPLGSGATQPASAAVLLDRAAAAALAQPTPTDRQLIYSDTAIYYATYPAHGGHRPSGHVMVRQQEWQSPVSPSAFYRTTPCDVDGDLQRGQATCSFQGGYAPGATSYSTYAGLRTLPTTPGRLLAYLAGLPSGGQSRYDREWSGANLIANLNPVLPPKFGAALFRAVARIPGTVLLHGATDAAGAHGIGLARPAGGVQEELIFDPSTYRLIGQQEIVLHEVHGRAVGYVTSATALLQTRFVHTGPGSGAGGTGASSSGGPRGGQFIYTDTRILARYPAPSAHRLVLRRASQQMWQSVDGSRPGALSIAPCPARSAACLLLIPPGPQAPALTTYAGLAGLPHPPGALLSYLRQHSPCPSSGRIGPRTIRFGSATREWNTVTAVLGNNLVLPPGLGRALFGAAARIPGAVVLRHVADAAGGHGIAVARNQSPRLRTELIFAPRSYRFVGVQDVLTHPVYGLRAGAVWAASSQTAAKIVNTAPVASLAQSYSPTVCGYTPGFYATSATSSSGSASSSASSSSSP